MEDPMPTIDRTTKAVLVTIALGLWVNIGVSILRPLPAVAQSSEITSALQAIQHDLHAISVGLCLNDKIC
jgi:hypothetical protein